MSSERESELASAVPHGKEGKREGEVPNFPPIGYPYFTKRERGREGRVCPPPLLAISASMRERRREGEGERKREQEGETPTDTHTPPYPVRCRARARTHTHTYLQAIARTHIFLIKFKELFFIPPPVFHLHASAHLKKKTN